MSLYWILQTICLGILAIMVVFAVKDRDGIRAIAYQTWKESIRSKGFWLVLVFAIPIFFGLTLTEVAGSEKFGEEWKIRNTLEWSLRLMGLFTAITSIFLTSLSLPNDITDRRIYTLISKPVSRWGVICGKVLGFSFFSFTMLLSMAFFMVIFVRWTARDASTDVKQRMLGSRELIGTVNTRLLAYRNASITNELGLMLKMRPYTPPNSMFRFVVQTPQLNVIKKNKDGFIASFITLGKLADKSGNVPEEESLPKERHITIQLVDPNKIEAGKPIPEEAGPQLRIPLDPKEAYSPIIHIDPRYFVHNKDSGTSSLGIKVISIEPETAVNKLDFARTGETRRWLFTNLNRKSLQSKEGTVTIQSKLRMINRSGYFTGAKRVDLGFWYYHDGKRDKIEVTSRDDRGSTFEIPSDAISPEGDLLIDLECPLNSPIFYGADGDKYTLSVLSQPRSFEFNVLKAVAMLSCQIIIIVVVAVSSSTFLSWPVTALTAIFVYFCGSLAGMFGEIISSIGVGSHHSAKAAELSIWQKAMRTVIEFLQIVTPNLDRFSPMEMLSHGYSVTFGALLQSFLYMNIFVTLALTVGWLVFRRRSIH